MKSKKKTPNVNNRKSKRVDLDHASLYIPYLNHIHDTNFTLTKPMHGEFVVNVTMGAEEGITLHSCSLINSKDPQEPNHVVIAVKETLSTQG